MPTRYWLFKTEPDDYSFSDLERDGQTRWDGVSNALALKNLRGVRRGDRILIYHTGKIRAAVGTATAVSDSYVDPNGGDPKLAVVDVKPLRRLATPVALEMVKSREEFKDFDLVRLPRLSVLSVSKERWDLLLSMARRSA